MEEEISVIYSRNKRNTAEDKERCDDARLRAFNKHDNRRDKKCNTQNSQYKCKNKCLLSVTSISIQLEKAPRTYQERV